MPGIVTDKRILENGRFRSSERRSTNGQPSGVFWDSSVKDFLRASTQETTSFRTRGGEDDDALAEDKRIFRNGFTTNDPRYDRGHEFFTTRTESKTSHPHWECWNESDWRFSTAYHGPLVLDTGAFVPYPVIDRMSSSEAKALGTRAISATAPTAPHANIATSVAELLLGGSPSVIGTTALRKRSLEARQAGGEYLNVQFGWLPLLSDIRKSVTALKSATRIVEQLRRDSGKTVRRRFQFPAIQNVTEFEYHFEGSGFRSVPDNMVIPTDPDKDGGWMKTGSLYRSFEQRNWFSGAFTYYLAGDDSVWGKLKEFEQRGNVLLGTRVTPETLWELAPWSWLVDWQANIGAAIGAAERVASDSLVLRYGYLMSHTVAEDTYTLKRIRFHSGGPGPVNLSLRRETKERIRATPYGFGLDLSAFTDRQWAILGALGMTHAPRQLRLGLTRLNPRPAKGIPLGDLYQHLGKALR